MIRAPLVALLGLSLVQCAKPDGPTPGASASSSATTPSPAPSPPPARLDAAAPETPFEREVDALQQAHGFSDVTLSPDGARLAWVERFIVPGEDDSTYVIRVLDRKDPQAKPVAITAGASAKKEHDVAWSPDGKALAFLSDAPGHDGTQLYVATPDDAGSTPRKLTRLKGALDAPRFSPDGKTIALLFAENASNLGPIEAVAPVEGEADAHPPVQRLVLVDVGTGQMHPLTRADLYVFEYAWSPDGSKVAIVAAPPPGDAHWYGAKLSVVDAHSGEERAVFAPPKQMALPRWSRDGKSIAFIAGLMSDEGETGGDIFVVPADGSAPARDWTPAFRGSPSWLDWGAGDRIVFKANVGGRDVLEAVDASGKIAMLWSGGDESLGSPTFSSDGSVSAVVRRSFAQPSQVWAGAIENWQQITHANLGLNATWGEARRVSWKSDGKDVQGWLVAPRVVEPGKRAPLIVDVHGGPASAAQPAFGGMSVLAGEGYFVFMPNPRGSFGQGEAFTTGNVKDFGYGDLRDILAGVDEVIRTAPVDANRIGIQGWSYGGYMSMWAVTQTTRFRAAMAGAGIANWQSYWGENSIGDWLVPYFGATVYDDPKVYARSSPIEFIKRVKTPTLILVGANDGECPAPQSFEFWRGLEAQGVETQLVVYPGEGHGFRKAEHRRDRMRRILGWFDGHLKP